MAAAGFPTHSMQVMHRKHAAPRCSSTQTAAGAKSPCGRLLASERMLDDRVGAGRAGFVAQTPCQRCVNHSSCSRPFVGFHRMRTCVHCKPRNHGRSTRQRMSLRARCHTFGQRIHTSMQSSSLAPRRRTRHLPIKIHRRPLSEGRLGRKGAWGGREAGAEGRLGRKGAWGGREAGADGSMGRKGAWAEGSMGQKGVWGAKHDPTHHPPLAPSSYDISQPAGRHLPYLIRPPGEIKGQKL